MTTDDWRSRAETAEQMLVEMRDVVRVYLGEVDVGALAETTARAQLIRALAATEPVTKRWVSREAYDEALNAIIAGDDRLAEAHEQLRLVRDAYDAVTGGDKP